MKLLAFLVLGLAMVVNAPSTAQAKSTLEIVKKRGTLIAGVRKKVPNFGFTNEQGEIVGFDIEIARGITIALSTFYTAS